MTINENLENTLTPCGLVGMSLINNKAKCKRGGQPGNQIELKGPRKLDVIPSRCSGQALSGAACHFTSFSAGSELAKGILRMTNQI